VANCEITLELVKKELKAGKTTVDETLSDSKKLKIKDFVKMYMGKVMARHKGRQHAKPTSSGEGDKVEEAEERGSQSTGETSPQQPGSASEKTPAVGGQGSPEGGVLEEG
jgi:SRI (Set2 Rpb1 interacting) domain